MIKNKYSQAQKKEMCDKHKAILWVIYHIGFEKMLQRQVIDVSLMLRYYSNEWDVKNAIQELEQYQIIKKLPTINNNKFIVLCKYGRAYVRGISDSQKVAAYDSDMSIANQFDRIARVQLFIEHFKAHKYTKFSDMKSFNTYLTREDSTHKFYAKIINLKHPQLDNKKIKELYDKALNDYNFNPAQVDENHQSKPKTQFNLDNDVVTLRQLIQKKIYMKNITQNETHIIFEFDLVDANNRYTPRKFKENVLYVQKFVDNITIRYGARRYLIKMNYICTDQDKLTTMTKDMNHRSWDNKKARYTSESKLEQLNPTKTLNNMGIEQKISFRTLESSHFKAN